MISNGDSGVDAGAGLIAKRHGSTSVAPRIASILLLVLPGCATSYGLGGRVGAVGSCEVASPATQQQDGAPLAGVRVSVFCGQGIPPVETTTDARGSFKLLEGKHLDERCEVVLEKAGYETRRYPAHELCAPTNPDGNGPYCGVATELLPLARSEAPR